MNRNKKILPLLVVRPDSSTTILRLHFPTLQNINQIPNLIIEDMLGSHGRSTIYYGNYSSKRVVIKYTPITQENLDDIKERFSIFDHLMGIPGLLLPEWVAFEHNVLDGRIADFVECYIFCTPCIIPTNPPEIRRFVLSILSSLISMNKRGTAHMDFKLENIMNLGEARGELAPVIIDFGESRFTRPFLGERAISTTLSLIATSPVVRDILEKEHKPCIYGFSGFLDCLVNGVQRSEYVYLDQILFGIFLCTHFLAHPFYTSCGVRLIAMGIAALTLPCARKRASSCPALPVLSPKRSFSASTESAQKSASPKSLPKPHSIPAEKELAVAPFRTPVFSLDIEDAHEAFVCMRRTALRAFCTGGARIFLLEDFYNLILRRTEG